MDWTHWLVILGALVAIFGASAYIKDTVSGHTKPNIITWSMWATAPLIGTAAALAADADPWTVVRTLLAGLLPLMVVIAAIFTKNSLYKIDKFDVICGIFSLAALFAWLIVNQPIIAVLLAASGDGAAALPTLKKAWKHPETETGVTYITGTISTILPLFSIKVWNIENSAFPAYLLLINLALTVAVYRKQIFKNSNA